MLTEVFASLGGVSVVLTGLFAYLGNTRLESLKSDLAATNERLRAELSHSVHVTQAQFDLELQIYRDIWAALFPVRNQTYALRPMLDSFDPSESQEDRMKRRLKDFGQAFNPASTVLENNRPFIPPDIYASFREILTLCRTEAIEYQHRDPNEMKEYWHSARRNQEQMQNLIDATCASIQKRLSESTVSHAR